MLSNLIVPDHFFDKHVEEKSYQGQAVYNVQHWLKDQATGCNLSYALPMCYIETEFQ